MAKDPAFLMYYQDFLVGTAFLTNEEVGAYIRILLHQADKGPLSMDEITTIVGPETVVPIWAKICNKFQKGKDEKWYNMRLAMEVNKRKTYCKSRSDNRKRKPTHD